MQVTLVPPEGVVPMWPKIRQHMQKAAEYTYGRYEVDDILVSITDYGHHLWVAFDDTGIHGAVVTTFKHYPRKLYLDMTFCGGDEGFTWKEPMLQMLRYWAHDNACDGIESSGRIGWARIFKGDGYKPLWQTYELPIADTGLPMIKELEAA